MADFGFAQYGQDDEIDEEDEEAEMGPAFTKDGIVFLIDCSKEMFEIGEDATCHFQISIKCIKTTMQNKIVSSEKDSVGVVFFGTDKSDGPDEHINIYHNLDQPCASRILTLENMEELGWRDFDNVYGHNPGYSLADALWTCADMFSKCPQKLNLKRVMLFTNNDDPHAGNPDYQRKASTKARDLYEADIKLELIHLSRPGQTFDVNKFYKDLLFLENDFALLPDPAERLEELLTRVRVKDHKKRAIRRLPLTLAEGLSLSVGVYNLVHRCSNPPKVQLSKKDNSELKTHTKTYLKDTVEILMPQDLKRAQIYAGKKICFENEEVTEMRRFGPPGLKLMGFKPRSTIKPHYHVKAAQFIYPDEESVTGSTTLFTALLRKCLDRDVVAVCLYTPTKHTPPRFVALLPQEEELDHHKVQLTPPGFHVIFLPFADDFRKITHEEVPKASEEQISAAKEVIKKLKFQFSSEAFENPVLQNHWRNIEALALDREEPDELIDFTNPSNDKIQKKAGSAIRDFKELVFPADYAPGQKKKAPSESARKAKAAETVVELDLEKEAREGRLAKLTVPMLREAIRNAKIPCSVTRKADLIDVINKYYGV